MILRTPRRRISPRTKRRCRAIRDFFRRALGSSSQKDIKINSDIAVNVTDLKHKIVGIERQLDEVQKNCDDLACIESNLRQETSKLLATESTCQHEIYLADSTIAFSDEKRESTAKKGDRPQVTLRRNSDETEYVSNEYRSTEERKHKTLPATTAHEKRKSISKHRHRKSTDEKLQLSDQRLQKHRRSTLEAFGDAAGTSFYSLAPPPLTEYSPPAPRLSSDQRLERKHYKRTDNFIDQRLEKRHKHHSKRNKSVSPQRYHKDVDLFQEKPIDYLREDLYRRRNRKNKKERSTIDAYFITDIIKKQYTPTNIFGHRGSQISQFSAPVCRDQEFSLNENVLQGVDLCSCCYEIETYRQNPHRSPYRLPRHKSQCDHHNYYESASVCDARLYRPKRTRAPRHYRYVDIYNDASLYDVVPVKEKSSPKSRRKFEEDNVGYNYYREVPPSPTTHRPRLNLKAQHDDYEEYMIRKQAKKSHLESHKQHYEHPNIFLEGEDVYSDMVQSRDKYEQLSPRLNEIANEQQNDNTTATASQECPLDNTMNKTHDAKGLEKGDKALDEIKDILLSFLKEIKKEPTPRDKGQDKNIQTNSSSDTTDTSGIPGNIGVPPSSYTVAQCSIPNQYTPFTNPRYCHMPPICTLSYMPSGCLAQSTSCTCHLFPPKQSARCQECSQKTAMQDTDNNCNTDELIKEIHKLVTLNPHSARKKNPDQKKENSGKGMTSRSVGDSYCRVSLHDVKVATSSLKCYSKSCEAIGTSYTARSDTAIERLSLDISESETEFTTTINMRKKEKPKNKLTNVFKGLFKKKKTDTESSFEVDIVPKLNHPPPFRQEMYSYAMHEQEFYNKPPYPSGYGPYGYVPPPPGCERRGPYYPPGSTASPGDYTPLHLHEQTIPEHAARYYCSHTPPSMHPYHHPYNSWCNHHAPQVPLCLKEVEVKSTGTQSDRKISFFRKLGRRTPPDERKNFIPRQPRFSEGTQSFEDGRRTQKLAPGASKPLFPGWQKFQEKVQKDLEQDPQMYNYNLKKKLQDGNKKLKASVVKKMFYNKNPFSPNNLIIKTLLGNDRSSFG